MRKKIYEKTIAEHRRWIMDEIVRNIPDRKSGITINLTMKKRR